MHALGLRPGTHLPAPAHQLQQLRPVPEVALDLRLRALSPLLRLQPVHVAPVGGARDAAVPRVCVRACRTTPPVQTLGHPAAPGTSQAGLRRPERDLHIQHAHHHVPGWRIRVVLHGLCGYVDRLKKCAK